MNADPEQLLRLRTARSRSEQEIDLESALSEVLASPGAGVPTDGRSPFRRDRDRLLYSTAFARLSGVTQVITPSPSGLQTHNRLTHSLKVGQLARTIAEHIIVSAEDHVLAPYGGVDADVAEAAAYAHDIGHPPFGHIGEEVLDEVGREWGLVGFEGNAQSFRIVTRLEQHALDETRGLDLTSATLAAILKYPWIRSDHDDRFPLARDSTDLPLYELRKKKFCSYETPSERTGKHPDTDFARALELIPKDKFGRPLQAPEASIMDIADDITYAMHDLEDFYRSRIITGSAVSAAANSWLRRHEEKKRTRVRDDGDVIAALYQKLEREYPTRFRRELLDVAVEAVANTVETAMKEPFDGSPSKVSTVRALVSATITKSIGNLEVGQSPTTPLALVRLGDGDWHFIEVIKALTRHFVIARPNMASVQRGQRKLLSGLVHLVDDWRRDEAKNRLPQTLSEYIDNALQESDSALAPRRAVLDYVASLSDHQAIELHRVLRGGLVDLAGGFV
ncbi:deoxyguanosinetriphosphate triphosphohydrolase family protein [Cellulomonas sp. PhB150]|uniref:deoxyguanosinetriphosphate triphosphohydrolase family protein n=1 Tax=Cellulomonas sp. PhB150 TaxID=2485188 RepID=UPI000F477180|nr:dNTP triphosphohydrolase [Cellulomonas sp. PhB150]ROS21802.1 dGTPase [Cellulomonas sp. PhB150]